jgi:NitT/TauT family transport system substrate-binding protein
MNKRSMLVRFGAALIPLALVLSACAGAQPSAGAKIDPAKDYGEVKMGYQFGTSYLPIVAVIENGLLEKRIKVKVSKQQLGGGGALTEAMLSNSTDIGFMGLGPFFVGWAKGVDWKIAVAMEDMPIGLNTTKAGATSLKDIGPNDKIALPGIN